MLKCARPTGLVDYVVLFRPKNKTLFTIIFWFTMSAHEAEAVAQLPRTKFIAWQVFVASTRRLLSDAPPQHHWPSAQRILQGKFLLECCARQQPQTT